MKRRTLPIAAAASIILVTAAVWLGKSPETPPPPKPATTTATADGMTLVTATDPTLVFQKAFWRRPASDDKILHAERREWSTGDGVRKWQWFIAVSPGPQLLDWLKTNPFSLATQKSATGFEHPPEWFPKPSGDLQIHQNAEHRFILMFSADQKHLYATDSGLGFGPPSAAP